MSPLYKTVYRYYKITWLAGLQPSEELMTEQEFFNELEKNTAFKEKYVLLKNEFKYLVKQQKIIILDRLKHKVSFNVLQELEEIIMDAPYPEAQPMPKKGDYGYNSIGELGMITKDAPVMTDEGLTWFGIQLNSQKLPWKSKNPVITGHVDL